MLTRLLFFSFILLNGSILFAQVDTAQTKLAFDLGITRGRNIYLWPIIKKTTEPEGKDLQIAFTVFQNKRNYKDTFHHSHLLPLYWHDSSTKRVDTRYLTFGYPSVFRTHHDKANQVKSLRLLELAPEISLVEYSKSKDGSYLKNSLLFFLWYKNDQLAKRSYLVAFPLYWSFGSPTRKTNTLFPLYSYGSYHNLDYKYLAITPLFWHFNYGQKGSTTAFYPLFYHKNYTDYTDTIKRTVLFPIYFGYNYNNYHQKNVLFPLYWSFQRGRNYTRTIFPILWSNRTGDYKTFTFFPFVSAGHSDNHHRNHLLITPLAGRVRTASKTTQWLFPVGYRNQQYISYKQFKTDSVTTDTITTTRIFPWYVSETSTKRKNTERRFFPVYWRYKNPKRDDYVLFPLIWKYNNTKQKAFAFMPFFAKGVSKNNTFNYYAITPLFWHKNRLKLRDRGYSNVLFPIWWQRKSWNGSHKDASYNVFFPLWWHYTDSGIGRNSKVLFPFVWSLKSKYYRTMAIMPFFSKGQSANGDKKHLAITPLFWQFKNLKGIQRFLIPVWWYSKSGHKISNTLFPLWWSRTDNRSKARVLFPIYWRYARNLGSKYETHRSVVFPLYWKFIDRTDTNSVLFPLSFSYKNNIRKAYVFFPLYLNHYNRVTNSRTKAITPLIWHYHDPERKVAALFPLVYFRKEKIDTCQHKTALIFPFYFRDNNTYSNISTTGITPFVWLYRSEAKSSTVLFPLYFHKRQTIDSAVHRTSFLFPIFYRKSAPDQKKSVLFPLVFSFKNDRYSSFTMFPLFSKGKSADKNNRHFVLTPLFWNIHKNKKHTVNLVPLFSYSSDQYQRKKFSILYFLYHQTSTPSEKKINFLWPICEYRKDSVSTAFRFAPMVWYRKAPGYSHYAFLPFYYYKSSGEGRQFNFLWQLYVHKRDTNGNRRNNYLFKALIMNQYAGNDYEYRFLYKAYSHVKKNGRKELSVFPFFYKQSDSATGSAAKSCMLGIYSKFKRPIPNTTYFYEEEKILWFIRLRSNYKSLKAKGLMQDKH